MTYIQGTMVKLTGRFTDRDTGAVTAVTEAVLTVEDPVGGLSQYTLSADQVQHDTDDLGDFYFFILDTSPHAGPWRYQFESTGNEATLGRKNLTVKPRLGVPVP